MFFDAAMRPGLYSTAIDPLYAPFGTSGFLAENPIMGMFAQMGSEWLFGSTGMVGGQFQPTQNMYDQLMSRRWMLERMKASNEAYRADRPEVLRLLRGASEMLGLDYNADRMRAAGAISDSFLSVMPYISNLAPGMFDAMMGSEGSRGIAVDAIFRHGRHMVDPVTGRSGLSSTSAVDMAERMYRELYRSGEPGTGLIGLRGMGQGSAASLFAELDRMGMVGRSIGTMSTAERAAAINMPEQLVRAGGGAVEGALRQFDAHQASESVKKMAGAISAVRDLFGDNGRADAPMAQLIQALSDLSGGGLQTINSAKLESDVRTAKTLMSTGGLTLDAYGSILARSGAAAQAYGLDPTMAASISRGAVSSGIAYQRMGLGAVTAFGTMSREEFTQKDVQLRASAAASGQANEMAALVRFQEEVGGLQGEDLEIYNAIKRGDNTYGPDGRSLFFQPNEIHRRLSQYQGDAAARGFIGAREVNSAYVSKYDIGARVRESGQPEEVRQLAATSFMQKLTAAGVDPRKAANIAAAMSDRLMNMEFADAADDAKRTDALADMLSGVGLRGGQTARSLVSNAYGLFGEMTRDKMNMAPVAALQIANRPTLDRAHAEEREAREQAAFASALSPLNTSGPVARIADAIKGGRDGDWKTLVQKIMGYENVNDVIDTFNSGEVIGDMSDNRRLETAMGATRMLQIAFAESDSAGRGLITEAVRGIVSGSADEVNASLSNIKSAYGLSDKDVASILDGKVPVNAKGEPKLPDHMAAAIRGMSAVTQGRGLEADNRGLLSLAREKGFDSRVRLDARDVEDTKQNAADAAGLFARRDQWSEAAREKTGNLVDLIIGGVSRYAEMAIADDSGATLYALGGEKALSSAETATQLKTSLEGQAAELSKRLGRTVSVKEMLTSDDPQIRQFANMTGAQGIFNKLGEINDQFDEAMRGKKTPRTAAERKAAAEETKKLGELSADARKRMESNRETNLSALDQLLEVTGGALSPEQREKLVESLDKDDVGSWSFGASVNAVEMLHNADAGKVKLSDVDRKALESQAGSLYTIGKGDGKVGVGPTATADAVSKYVSEISKKDEDAGGGGETTNKITFSFAPGSKLSLDRDGFVDFSRAKGVGVGSAPQLS